MESAQSSGARSVCCPQITHRFFSRCCCFLPLCPRLQPQEKYLEREIQALDKNLEELADEQDAKRQAAQ